MKTNTKNQLFDWNAQSLKPLKNKKVGFGDDFGLMRKHPRRWHYGQDGTGDIRNLKNIFYYKQFTQNVSLITSDCGIPWSEPGYEHIAFSSLTAIQSATRFCFISSSHLISAEGIISWPPSKIVSRAFPELRRKIG